MYHILKLFQSGPDLMVSRKPLVSEFYEEIIFQEPTQLMRHLLSNIRPTSNVPVKHETDCKLKMTAKSQVKGSVKTVLQTSGKHNLWLLCLSVILVFMFRYS